MNAHAADGMETEARGDPADRYVVIASSGRSGSNRLLDLLDQHDRTNCRSELDATWPGFVDLPRPMHEADLPDGFADLFATRVAEARLRRGERDHFWMLGHKSYLRAGLGTAWMHATGRQGVRARVMRGDAATDWRMPGAILRPDVVAGIVPVFKLQPHHTWYAATHRAHRGQVLIHNIRDPRRYLLSWYNRFVLAKRHDLGDLYRTVTRLTIPALSAYDRAPPPVRFSLHDLLRHELLHWRYTNERMMAMFEGSARYLRVTYEEASKDRMAVAERIYDHAGLEMDDGTRARIAGLENTIFAKPHRETLDPEAVEAAVRDALPDGPIAEMYR